MGTTAKTPYYAVIFTSQRADTDPEGYERMAKRMVELAAQQPGYLGIDSARGADGVGITVSYWQDLDSIRKWRENAEHREAQTQGRALWYAAYQLRICQVQSEYGLNRSNGEPPALAGG